MHDDKPAEWCLAWVGPCLPSAEWASWAQAIFGMLAILATIGLFVAQQRATKKEMAQKARFAGMGVLATMDQSIAVLELVAENLTARIRGEQVRANLVQLSDDLATVLLPSPDELSAIHGGIPECAATLLLSKQAIQQLRPALMMLANSQEVRNNAEMAEILKPMASLGLNAAEQLTMANRDLSRFCYGHLLGDVNQRAAMSNIKQLPVPPGRSRSRR